MAFCKILCLLGMIFQPLLGYVTCVCVCISTSGEGCCCCCSATTPSQIAPTQASRCCQGQTSAVSSRPSTGCYPSATCCAPTRIAADSQHRKPLRMPRSSGQYSRQLRSVCGCDCFDVECASAGMACTPNPCDCDCCQQTQVPLATNEAVNQPETASTSCAYPPDSQVVDLPCDTQETFPAACWKLAFSSPQQRLCVWLN